MKNSHSLEFYHAAIRSVDPYACDIRQPEMLGKISKIFFADVLTETYVYRFTNESFIYRNNKISQLLTLCDVAAPRTTIHCYMKTLFEKYKYCPDPTLRERMNAGMTDDEIMAVYQDTLRIQFRLFQIDAHELAKVPNMHYHTISAKRTREQFPSFISHLASGAIFLLSRGGKLHLFHNDLNPGNILVSSDNRVSFLLDLDGINLSNLPFSVTRTMFSYPGTNYEELLDFYEELTQQKLPRITILAMLKLLQTANAARHKFNHALNTSR